MKKSGILSIIFIYTLLFTLPFLPNWLAAQSRLTENKAAFSKVPAQPVLHKGFTIRLLRAEQYMQSVQLIFEMKNQDSVTVNNCWFHVGLSTPENTFLYREQPLLFNQLKPFGSQKLELLCESIGIEEVGFVILIPVLYEADREESEFNYPNIRLEVAESIQAKLLFSHDIE